MRKIFQVLLIIGFACMSTANISGGSEPPSDTLSKADMQLAGSSTRFGLELFKRIVETGDPYENIFISPLSVSYALAMTLNGADAETESAISATLRLSGISREEINTGFRSLMPYLAERDSQVAFEIANSIWYRDGLPVRNDFVEQNRDNFDAEIRPLISADAINDWVKEKTKDKISKIVNPPISPETIMFLINAIYFKGSWSTKFKDHLTRDHPFYLLDGSETTCRMMFDTRDLDYFSYPDFQAARLPYGDSAFSMLVFLPKDTAGITDLLAQLNDSTWTKWRGNFYTTEVEFGLPRLKFEYDITLNDVLKGMGMAIAFDERKADFGRMVDLDKLNGENVYIDKVKHKTFLQVDEEGTEAAAVTSVTMALTSAVGPKTPVMIVDHPFLFAIEERSSGSLTFIGRVMAPEWKE